MFGFAAHEMIGRSILAIVPPGREDEESRVLARVSAGHVERFETVRVRKDGATLDVSVTTSPVRDAAGRIVAASKVARDISERRRADRALTQARDAAEAANRELRAFSYSVAHDLRAPLRGMNGFAQVLLDSYGDKLGADAQDWLGEILLNARKMGELIDGLLSLARLTREELTREPIDLSALAREVARDLASAETERSVDFEVDDGLQVEADVRLARALLENLLGNAWKFTRHAAAPRVELRAVNQGGARAFVVRDNGAGFDSAYAGKLFAPFQRLHTTAEFPGTGIGLATVERVVHRHGGRVWAEGSVGGGAAFYFTLSAEAGRGASS
jgi:PAS domain S-box-containing protein